jgi:DNA-binding HxlR family transcriptional regulator
MAHDTSASYLRFLNLAQAIRQLPMFPQMDAVEERLLTAIAAEVANANALTVRDAMKILPDVSESTIHRRLKNLRKNGLIALNGDDSDERVRYVVPTPLAEKYFAKLGECLARAQG